MRAYKKGDELNILKLMKASGFEREYQRTLEYWSWKYASSPYGHLTAVAECDGQLIGSMGLSLVKMKAGPLEILGSQAADLIVHPEFRRQGIFLAIGRFLLKEAEKNGVVVTYGFPNEQARSGHLKYGWFDVCEVPRLFKPVNMNNAMDVFEGNRMIRILSQHKTSKTITNFVLKEILSLASILARASNLNRKSGLQNLKIRQVNSFDDRVDNLWDRVSKDYEISVVRNRHYLNWRFFSCPGVKYTTLLAEDNEEMLGYAVLLCREEGNLRVGHIVDIFAPLNNGNVVRSLITEATEYFRQMNVDIIVCWMLKVSPTGHFVYTILRNNGFVRVPGKSTLFIARINSSDSSLSRVKDSSKWFVTKGDSDQV